MQILAYVCSSGEFRNISTVPLTLFLDKLVFFRNQNAPKSENRCIDQISAPNVLVRCDFSVVPDSVFLFSENSQIFLWSFLEFFLNS